MMASKIQTIQPRNMNLMNETTVYDVISDTNYHLHDYNKYDDRGSAPDVSTLSYVDSNMNLPGNPGMMKTNFAIPMNPYNKMIHHNRNVIGNNKRKARNHYNRAGSPRGYDSDESCTSYSSRETPENKTGRNNTNRRSPTGDSVRSQEFYGNYNQNSSNGFPNLYRPNTFTTNNKKNNFRFYPNAGGPPKYDTYSYSNVMDRRVHGLMTRFKSRAIKFRISDMNPPGLINGGPWDQLNQSIWDVFVSKIQKKDTYFRKLDLWKSVFLEIKKCLPHYGLFLVGSTMSGFGLESSDIDMCLLTKPFTDDPRTDAVHHLTQIRQLLLKNGIASSAELIMAKVPILKFKDEDGGFEVDLNSNNSVGIRNTQLLYCYAQMDWRVRPLVVMVKLWAQANNINDAKNMTISSYSWALMVIHYLQCGVSPPVLPCLHTLFPERFNSDLDNHNLDVQQEFEFVKDFESNNPNCLGDLLIGFFYYYSCFNYAQYAVSVRAGTQLLIDDCRYLRSPKNDPNQWKCLCIEEPFDFTNTARSVFDPDVFKHIKTVIATSYKELALNKTLNYVLPVNFHHQR